MSTYNLEIQEYLLSRYLLTEFDCINFSYTLNFHWVKLSWILGLSDFCSTENLGWFMQILVKLYGARCWIRQVPLQLLICRTTSCCTRLCLFSMQTKLLTSLQEIEDAKNWQNPLWKRRERPPDDW